MPDSRLALASAEFDGLDFESGAASRRSDAEVDETVGFGEFDFDFLPVGGGGPIKRSVLFGSKAGGLGAPGDGTLAAGLRANLSLGALSPATDGRVKTDSEQVM